MRQISCLSEVKFKKINVVKKVKAKRNERKSVCQKILKSKESKKKFRL